MNFGRRELQSSVNARTLADGGRHSLHKETRPTAKQAVAIKGEKGDKGDKGDKGIDGSIHISGDADVSAIEEELNALNTALNNYATQTWVNTALGFLFNLKK